MGFFKDFEECRSIVLSMMGNFSLQSQYKLKLAMNVCDSLIDDKDKRYRMKQTLYSILWDIPEAVNNGFKNYLDKEISKIRGFKNYHDKNCNDSENCSYCQERNNTSLKLSKWEREIHEGKRPTLSVK